jgi:bacterioferritin-associated ferredoxin
VFVEGDFAMGKKSLMAQRPDYLVCTCMEVMYSQIVEAIQEGVNTFEQLSDVLGVGTGCSSCVEEVYEILKEVLAETKK